MKTAVVFYSRTHATEQVATLVAQQAGADLLQIKSKLFSAGARGYLQALWHTLQPRPETLEMAKWNLQKYDLVFIGSPVWRSHVSAPIREFFARESQNLRQVAFFVTYGGSGADTVLQKMASLSGQTPVATFAIKDSEIAGKGLDGKIAKFVGTFQPDIRPSPAKPLLLEL